MAGNVIGSVMLRPCPTQLFQLRTLGEGEELGQDLWERPFPPDPSVWDTSLLLQPVCAISSQALVRLAKSGTCSTVDIHGYWCNFCQYTTDDKADFAKHVITHRFSCQFCLFSSFTRSNVILHIIASHGEKEASADLKYCVLRMDVEEEESAEEREPLPVSERKRFFQALSLSGEVFKKRKLFSQGEGGLSKVAKRFPSDSPSSLSFPLRSLPNSSSAPGLEIDTAEDAVAARTPEESTQARRCSPIARGNPMSQSPRPGSNGNTGGSRSPHAVRGSQSRPSSQPPSGDGSRGFQTLRRLLIQPEEARPLSMEEYVRVVPNHVAMSLGHISHGEYHMQPDSDEEEWMSDGMQESSDNSSVSDEFQFHGSLKGIAAKAHLTRYRQRCTTASTSSNSSDQLVQRGRSSSLLQPTSQASAVATSRLRSNSLGDELNGRERESQQSGRFPLLYQYLTQENIMNEHLRRRTRAVQALKKSRDHREIEMEAPILRQCLSQASLQDKHSSPVPQVSSAAAQLEVPIKQEPPSEDFLSDAYTAPAPVTAPVSGVAVAFSASRGRPNGETVGNGLDSGSQALQTGMPISGSVGPTGGFPTAPPSHPVVKQEPVEEGFQYSTFIPTHQSKTSLTTSVMPSCASRSRERPAPSPPFPQDLPPPQSSQLLRSLAETPPPRNTELRRLLAEQRGPPAWTPQTASERIPGNASRGEGTTEGRGDVVQERPAAGPPSSWQELPPGPRSSSLLRSALLQAGSEVQPPNKKPSTDSGLTEENMHFSRLLKSLVPATHGQSSGAPAPAKSNLLPQLLMSSQPLSSSASASSTSSASSSASSSSSSSSGASLSTLSASQPMDLSRRNPVAVLPNLSTSAATPSPLKTKLPEGAAAASVAKDDGSSDGIKFLIGDVKSLSDSASYESGSEEKETATTEDRNGEVVDDAGSCVQNSSVGSPSDGEPGYREQPAFPRNDCLPEVLNLTTSDRTSCCQDSVPDVSPAGSNLEDLRQKRSSDTATHLSASLSPSSSLAPSSDSTSPSSQPSASGEGLCTEAASSPGGSHSPGEEAKDPVPGSSKLAPVREVRQAGMSVDIHSLLQLKMPSMGHYFPDNANSLDQVEATGEDGNDDYCSGHSSLWTDADKDVRKLTVETEEPGFEEMREDKRV